MRMAKISEAIERQLRALATPKGAKGYRAWLTSVPGTGAYAKRRAAATEERRLQVGYGLAGEALGRSSYADDGYAAYLREAAKSARSQRAGAIEDERVQESQKTLKGYGQYLEGLKKENLAALGSTAEKLLALEVGDDLKSEALIADVGATAKQAEALRSIYRSNPSADSKTREKVLKHLIKNYYGYEKAYEYCRLIGFSDTTARQLAKAADAERSAAHGRLEALFGRE